jgi:NAD(P)-dependent dehydrogenase (short-subunit alcohol dehydrogenase family)
MGWQRRVVLVSGAASGIGRAALRRHAERGDAVAALDLDAEGLDAATRELHGAVACHAVDVADPRAVAEAVGKIECELGPIDRVLCAAGVMPTGRLLDQDPQEIARVMQVNYGGAVNLAHAALPGMLERGRGDFVIYSTVLGWMPGLLLGAYGASKFALVSFAEVLAHENRGRGVRFACVCPSAVDTPMFRRPRGALRPKSMDQQPPLTPEAVLDASERALHRGRLFVFPSVASRAAWWLRRIAPAFLWTQIHRIEGW